MARPTVFTNALKIIKTYEFRKNSDFYRHMVLAGLSKNMQKPKSNQKFLGMALIDGVRAGSVSQIYGAKTQGANINFKTKNGWTALHICTEKALASKTHFEVIPLLVTLGADVNATNVYSETPLDMAKERWNKPLINYFNSTGAVSVSTLRL